MNKAKAEQIALHAECASEYARVRTTCVGTQGVNRSWNDVLLSLLPTDPNSRVLDDMCGTGTLLPDLLLRYRTVIGIDLSVPMLRERLCGAVACADAEALPFAAGSFDAVIVRGALHHIHPITDALAEIHAVLKPGGTLVLCEPCDDFPLVRWARRAMYRWMPYFGKEERTFRSRDLRRQLEAAGFTVTASARFGFLAYAVLGFPDIVPALAPLQRLPPRCLQWLCACDRWLAGVPIVKDWSLVYLVACEVS